MKLTIAKAAISGSTMHDIASTLNKRFKEKFGNDTEIQIENHGQFYGVLNLITSKKENHKEMWEEFKGVSSHADITINYKP